MAAKKGGSNPKFGSKAWNEKYPKAGRLKKGMGKSKKK